jgi:hypothetical protein
LLDVIHAPRARFPAVAYNSPSFFFSFFPFDRRLATNYRKFCSGADRLAGISGHVNFNVIKSRVTPDDFYSSHTFTMLCKGRHAPLFERSKGQNNSCRTYRKNRAAHKHPHRHRRCHRKPSNHFVRAMSFNRAELGASQFSADAGSEQVCYEKSLKQRILVWPSWPVLTQKCDLALYTLSFHPATILPNTGRHPTWLSEPPPVPSAATE